MKLTKAQVECLREAAIYPWVGVRSGFYQKTLDTIGRSGLLRNITGTREWEVTESGRAALAEFEAQPAHGAKDSDA